MRHALLGTLAASALAATLLAAERPVKVLDLGHPLADTDPTWTGVKVFSRTETANFAKDGAAMGKFSFDEHFGTHLDAPAHFGGSWTTDRIPVDRLVRPAVCIDITGKAGADEDYRLTVADIRAFEARSGPIAEGVVVLVATGWDRRWKEPGRYMNVRNGVKHFPGIAVEAAALLARDRKVAGIGIDSTECRLRSVRELRNAPDDDAAQRLSHRERDQPDRPPRDRLHRGRGAHQRRRRQRGTDADLRPDSVSQA